jgi:chromosomal replication initiation ATPase DnaA
VSALAKLPPRHRPLAGIAYDAAAAFVDRELHIDRAELKGPRRMAHLVVARAFMVWAIRNFDNPWLGYKQIGLMLGGRDPSTILNLDRKAAALRAGDPEFVALCDRFVALQFPMEETNHG